MADKWSDFIKEDQAKATSVPIPSQVSAHPKMNGDDDWKMWSQQADTPAGGDGGIVDYAKDTISNIPSSAGKFIGNIYQSVRHPADTLRAIGSIPVGLAEKAGVPMPAPGPGEHDAAQNLDAMWDALKQRYGSPHAFAETIRTDPVGAAADISSVIGGVGGLAKGTSAVARAASLPRAAAAAGDIADTARTVSNATNPMNLVTKPVGAAMKATGKGFTRSALPGLGGKAERYGASPATGVLENTSGVTPSAIKASALAHIEELGKRLDAVTAQAKATGNTMDLSAARQTILDEMQEVAKNNGLTDDLAPMYKQLTEPRPGFGGTVDPISGGIEAQQPPDVGLGMKRQFGKDYTKFDAAVPMKSETRNLGNRAYHDLSTAFNKAVPGAEPINKELQTMSPIPAAAQRAGERAGMVETGINRATRPTGALAAVLMGAKAAGVPGAILTMITQEGLSSPSVKMAIARALYGSGKATSNPVVSQALKTLGVSGEIAGSGLPQYAKGGIIRTPTLLSDMKTGKPTGIMAEEGPEEIKPINTGEMDDIGTQLDELTGRKRRAVLIPSGTFPRPIPDGMAVHVDSSTGNKIAFNPNLIGIHDIKTAVAMKRLSPILGRTHSPSAMTSLKHIMKQSRKLTRIKI